MDSINIFFDYNKWIIHWHKKLFKNIHLLYSFKPSISADILKFVLQGFWALQEYFVFEAVFTRNLQIKKYEIYLRLVIRFPARCCQQEATTTRFKRQKEQFASSAFDLLWVHALITLGSYLQPLLPDHNLVSYSQKKLTQPKPIIP